MVTGSSLEIPADAVPLTVIGSDVIGQSGGGANLLEVLRKQLPAFSGSGNLGLSNASTGVANTYGGSRLSLHNTPTLVLLNGRRVATNGANSRGGSSFVDVSLFPLSAVERIEVLADGASAVYGSDAIGGVVNVILKPAFNGTAVGGRHAFSSRDDGYTERSAYFVTGVAKGRLGLIVTGEYSKSTPLYQDERAFSSEARSGIFSGAIGSGSTAYYLAPGVGSPGDRVPTGTAATAANLAALAASGVYVTAANADDDMKTINLAPDVTLYAGREQSSLYAGATYQFIERRLEAFANLLFARANTLSQLPAQSVTFGSSSTTSWPPAVAAGSPSTPSTGNITGVNFRYQPAPRR